MVIQSHYGTVLTLWVGLQIWKVVDHLLLETLHLLLEQAHLNVNQEMNNTQFKNTALANNLIHEAKHTRQYSYCASYKQPIIEL